MSRNKHLNHSKFTEAKLARSSDPDDNDADADRMVFRGGRGRDFVKGGNGDDDLSGGRGRDKLFGKEGNDTLDGGGGRDNLSGGKDDGTFSVTTEPGGWATVAHEAGDHLTGGNGRDRFIYKSGDGVDVIHDFDRDDGDRIKLKNIDPDDIAIIQDQGDSIIVFLDGTTADPIDLIADSAIIVEGVDDLAAEDILFA